MYDEVVRLGGKGLLKYRKLYVRLAAHLDDGEAVIVALSAHRSLALVTDDKKEIRLADEVGVVEVFITPDILVASGLAQITLAVKRD